MMIEGFTALALEKVSRLTVPPRERKSLVLRRVLALIVVALLASLSLSAPPAAAKESTPEQIENMTGCNGGTCLHIESYGGSGTDVSMIKVYSAYSVPWQSSYVRLWVN